MYGYTGKIIAYIEMSTIYSFTHIHLESGDIFLIFQRGPEGQFYKNFEHVQNPI